jgi:hypothetical protein
MMLRHPAKGGASRFVAVLEPVHGKPSIKSVKRFEPRPGMLVLDIQAGSSRQSIVLGASVETEVPPGLLPTGRVAFRGETGVLSRTRWE